MMTQNLAHSSKATLRPHEFPLMVTSQGEVNTPVKLKLEVEAYKMIQRSRKEYPFMTLHL